MKVPIDRVMEKLDAYFAVNDYKGALRHLIYWYDEAKHTGDSRALLFITNELIGWHRKQGNKDKALYYCDEALSLCRKLDIEDTVGAATSYLNTATAYKAFGMAEDAIPFFIKAENIYKNNLPPDDSRIAGLYNNMGLALTDTGEYDKARELYHKAIEIMLKKPDGAPDAAISYLNLADTVSKEKEPLEAEKYVDEYLKKAQELLDSKKASSEGYYAFVCEKCAPVFGFYGRFLYEAELKERAEKIYAGA